MRYPLLNWNIPPKNAILDHFLKIKISIANCEKTNKDIQKPIRSFVKHHLKSFLSNFEPKKFKTLGGDSFCPWAFFNVLVRYGSPMALFEIFSKFFSKIFLSFFKGFQDKYGYRGLKLKTKKGRGGCPLLNNISQNF